MAAQMAMTIAAPAMLMGRWVSASALALYSAQSGLGTIFANSQMPSGRMIASSIKPSTGTKSGIRSIGESAYAATSAPKMRSATGVRGSRTASQIA